ncbi:hypothetical protein ACKWTF_014236 [Chironomus riparius]
MCDNSKNLIFTAAHCFDELEDDKSLSNDIKIFIGEWKVGIDPDCTDSEEENFSEETCFPDKVAEIPPKKLTIHKEYLKKKGTAGKSAYDIAIIELKRPPRVSKIIKSIDLPSEDTCEDEPDHPLMVTGFGETKPKHYTNMKKKVFITLHDQATCKRKLGLPFNGDKHFCGLGANNLATCKGDSGGPITNEVDGVPTLQGVVSFGAPECGHGDTPSGFLRVACFIDWIDSYTGGAPLPEDPKPTREPSTTARPTRTTRPKRPARPKPTTTVSTTTVDDFFNEGEDDPFA